jgi:Carbohydrate esterase, sialic acid-specific acetylesterase
MGTAVLRMALAIGSFAVACCGLAAILVLAFKLRRVLRQHSIFLKAEELNSAHLNSQILQIGRQLQQLAKALNDATKFIGFDLSRVEYETPSDIILGSRDTYEHLDWNWGSIHDPTGRRESRLVIEADRRRTAVIVIVGQSNAANHGTGRYVAKRRVDNFSLYDGKCYHAADPLLGASGDGGNFATRLGDKLIEVGLFDRVILAPIAMGGTTVEQWAEEGMFNRRIPVVIRRLYDVGLSADFILWQQGEGNQGIGDIGGRQYRKNLLEVIWTFRRYGVTAPFFVALTTTCGGPHPNAENIRAGQTSAVNPMAAIYQGADTDTVSLEHRSDTCHFNEVGLDIVASLWLDVIATYCRSAHEVVVPTSSSGSIELAVGGQNG